jgi:hypothetical protein
MSDIRKSFRDLERSNTIFRRKVSQLHSHFYQKIVPGRAEERAEMDRVLKLGGFMRRYNLVEIKKTKKKE